MFSQRVSYALMAAVVCVGMTAGAAEVTFNALLNEMTDIEGLTRLPSPSFTCKQFSSYDPRSTNPADLSDEGWFANGDRGQHIRSEQRNGETEWVLMDAAGPGAIVRIWSANPADAGVVRVYLDGSETPVIEMPLQELLGGTVFPFVTPIAGVRASGWNSYLPIPYATHCKVTCSKPDFYYHVNYRTYEPGTQMELYSPALAESHQAQLEAVAVRLANPVEAKLPADASPLSLMDATLEPGASKEFRLEKEGAAIYRLETRVHAEDMTEALRACWLEIYFDSMAAPAVAAPVGDFYSTAPGLNAYESLPSGVLADGMLYMNWIMPFQREARVRVTNHSAQTAKISMNAVVASRPWTADSLYFHAAWRAEFDIPTRPRQDWTHIAIEGAGRFVGDSLHVTNPTPAWWGEGDEKIFVDQEDFPSHFGTGSEDYYGYAWCSPEVFVHAYHNQPRCDGPANYGHTIVNRFHILDVIPFTTALKFDMEIWHWADVAVSMAATTYCYVNAGSTVERPAFDRALLRFADLPPIARVEGGLEGEDMTVVSLSGGGTTMQQGVSWDWSGGAQIWWTGGKVGDELVLGFPVETAGRYELDAVLTKARDYGIVTLAINEGAPGEPIDLYNENVVVTPLINLGAHDLREGQNLLKVKLAGTNEKAVSAYMFGIDYLKLRAN